MIHAAPSSARPSGALRRRPQGRFFSAAMIAPSSSIKPMLPMPTTNIRSISAEQDRLPRGALAPPMPGNEGKRRAGEPGIVEKMLSTSLVASPVGPR
jgi:hypothetical protein